MLASLEEERKTRIKSIKRLLKSGGGVSAALRSSHGRAWHVNLSVTAFGRRKSGEHNTIQKERDLNKGEIKSLVESWREGW